jgi:hypothetical protein
VLALRPSSDGEGAPVMKALLTLAIVAAILAVFYAVE